MYLDLPVLSLLGMSTFRLSHCELSVCRLMFMLYKSDVPAGNYSYTYVETVTRDLVPYPHQHKLVTKRLRIYYTSTHHVVFVSPMSDPLALYVRLSMFCKLSNNLANLGMHCDNLNVQNYNK